MAPTICSGKKRESRTIINSNIRRNGGQSSHQLNQTLSNIVNYVAKDSLNARVSASLRIRTHSQSDKCADDNTTAANLKKRQQQFSFLSDNAVTSSRHSDTENSMDLCLANETLTNNLTPTYSANTLSTSLSSPLSSLSSSAIEAATSPNERTSSSTSPYEERRFYRYSLINKTSSDNDATDLYKEDKDSIAFNKRGRQIHSSSVRKYYYDCKEFNTEEDEELEEIEHYQSSSDSDTDMDTDESESVTSLDIEKSAKFEKGNNLLLRDKFLVEQHQRTENDEANEANDNSKPLASISSQDGLLSIAIKTIKLVKRNQLLQQKLTQLQMETSEFIQSVLANPENRRFRKDVKQFNRLEVDDNV